MQVLILILAVVGGLVAAVGSIMFLVAAFRQGALWGLAVFLLPLANLVFLVKYWAEAKRAFVIQVVGTLIVLAAMGMGVFLGTGTLRPSNVLSGGAPSDETARTHIARDDGGTHEAAPEMAPQETGRFLGRTLEEVKNELGNPQATMKVNGKTFYIYGDRGLELMSVDGVKVSGEEYGTVSR